jgi:hypothetical protein
MYYIYLLILFPNNSNFALVKQQNTCLSYHHCQEKCTMDELSIRLAQKQKKHQSFVQFQHQ